MRATSSGPLLMVAAANRRLTKMVLSSEISSSELFGFELQISKSKQQF